MSRDASGNYTLPVGNPVVTATAITVTWGNTTMSDIATEMTDSLSRSGKGGMLAAVGFNDGTVSLPGISWVSDPNSGFYRIGADNIGMSLNGVKVIDYTTTDTTFTNKIVGAGDVALTSSEPVATFTDTNTGAWVDGDIIGSLSFVTNDPTGIGAHETGAVIFENVDTQASPVTDFVVKTGAYNTLAAEAFRLKGVDKSAIFAGNINAVAGGINLGATGSANLLDDYEEGTWTPVLSDAATGGNTAALGSAIGEYQKVGNKVHILLRCNDINTAGMTGSNNLYIQGLPFAAGAQSLGAGSAVLDLFTFSGYVVPTVLDSGAYITLRSVASGAGDATLLVSAVDGATSDIERLSISYKVD